MERRSDSWKQKVHPLFVTGAGAYRDAVNEWLTLGSHPPAEKVAEIDARFQQKIEAVRTHYAGAQYTPTANEPLDIIFVEVGPSSWPPSQRESNQGFLEILYWKRFNEPLWIALQKEAAGDLDALRRIQRVEEDYERLRFRKGPIKAAKGDPDHAALLELGLDLGLSTLSPEELADCFDEVCPCGKIHDADALKKQRSRKQKAILKARQWLTAERAKMSAREWMAVYGMHGLYAKGVPSIDGVPRRDRKTGLLLHRRTRRSGGGGPRRREFCLVRLWQFCSARSTSRIRRNECKTTVLYVFSGGCEIARAQSSHDSTVCLHELDLPM